MIHHLKGRLLEKNPAFCIVECAGVGYLVNISLNTYTNLADDENVILLTHLHISEDAHTLYGFSDEDERRLFRSLISVSGIGCSTARMMLSSMQPQEIESCIAEEDVSRLKKVKGIGEKTAQRIILELRGKLAKDSVKSGKQTGNHIKEQATNALLTLGFQRNAIETAIEKLLRQDSGMTVEELVKQSLKSL
ncbi:MAG: Holliday junction branch migration protein RuvA [Bacteroidota bacterium]